MTTVCVGLIREREEAAKTGGSNCQELWISDVCRPAFVISSIVCPMETCLINVIVTKDVMFIAPISVSYFHFM
jgi:hypothetical protein